MGGGPSPSWMPARIACASWALERRSGASQSGAGRGMRWRGPVGCRSSTWISARWRRAPAASNWSRPCGRRRRAAEPMSPAADARIITISLISHTNVGKTTLARTLLRRDVGEVLDQAHVTDRSERFVLYANERGDEVALADNPGFGDSVRLLRRLRGVPDPLAWLVGQVWDRFRDRALFCSQQAVRHLREDADVVLYLVNASEEPDEAGYLAPELELLGWIGRPVVLMLHQTGAPETAVQRRVETDRWRTFAAGQAVVRDVLPLDAFTRCWVQEGQLFERLRAVVSADHADLLDALVAH